MLRSFKSSSKNIQKSISTKLSEFLASTYSVYLKTQNFHWNITGSSFLSLHAFFEKQYEDLATAVDCIAERIRSLDAVAPGSFTEFAKLSKIKDSMGKKSAPKMLSELLADHLSLKQSTKELLSLIKESPKESQDDVTQDLLIERLQFHEKTIWILRSLQDK